VKAERGDGKIPIRVKTLTPVHISSGEYTVSGDNSMIYKEFVKVNVCLLYRERVSKGVSEA